MTKTGFLTLCTVLAVNLGLETAAATQEPRSGSLRHVVSFKFKESATPEQIRAVEDAFRALQETVTQIRSYEWGTNVSPENLAKGFTHCFVLTFETAADRDAYLVHPDHKAFGELLGPVLEDVFVIDFWSGS